MKEEKLKKLKKLVVRDGKKIIDAALSGENMRNLLGGSSSCGCFNCANLCTSGSGCSGLC
jgi:hypothetical protein